jgi:hypothetical protein
VLASDHLRHAAEQAPLASYSQPITDLTAFLRSILFATLGKFTQALEQLRVPQPRDTSGRHMISALRAHVHLTQLDWKQARSRLRSMVDRRPAPVAISFAFHCLTARTVTLQMLERPKADVERVNVQVARANIDEAASLADTSPFHSIEHLIFVCHLLHAIFELLGIDSSSPRPLRKIASQLIKQLRKAAVCFPIFHAKVFLFSGLAILAAGGKSHRKAQKLWADGLKFANDWNLPVDAALLSLTIARFTPDSSQRRFCTEQAVANLRALGINPPQLSAPAAGK